MNEPLRDVTAIKRYFYEKLCNKGHKPTGSSGGVKDVVNRAQGIYGKILKRVDMQTVGAGEEDDEAEDMIAGVDVQADDDEEALEEEGGEVAAAMEDAEEGPAKKKAKPEKLDNKSKNCKRSVVGAPRASAAGALRDIAAAYAENKRDGGQNMMAMLLLMMQQNQQQAAQQAAAQMQQMQMQMQMQLAMMRSMGGAGIAPMSAPPSAISGSSSSGSAVAMEEVLEVPSDLSGAF